MTHLPGVATASTGPCSPAPPLEDLDALPIPDYSDFPWDAYPNRVVSMLTGRGCGWGVCTFCSDVLTSNGRTFRSRSIENVLAELEHHHQVHGVDLFCFSDLKLNSNLGLWRALIDRFGEAVPDARWTCAVHVGRKGDQGLAPDDLRRARAAGLVRITTGVESGSQRVLDRMAKGTDLATTEAFLRDAAAAGISVRATMFTGFPGEEAEDVMESARLLERCGDSLERVSLSRFTVLPGTPIADVLVDEPARHPEIVLDALDRDRALIRYDDDRVRDRAYRKAVARLQRAVHRINRKELGAAARPLEGAM